MSVVAAVDIGGTKTSAGLVDASGALLATRSASTPARRGPDAVLSTAVTLVEELAAASGQEIGAVGVGSAGVIDPRRGIVVSATDAIAGWAGTDLRRELSGRLGLPVAVDNDVHAHALGEQWRGAAAGHADVLLVTVGTGIGGSLILDGRVRHGRHVAAGHVGHLPAPSAGRRPCPCGGRGHVEAVASGPAMLAEYGARTGGDATHLAQVARSAADGDHVAAAVLAEGAAALGGVLGGLVNVIDPEIVLVGGGVAESGDAWWRPLRAAFAAELLPALRDVIIEPAALGATAALLGAARLAMEAIA